MSSKPLATFIAMLATAGALLALVACATNPPPRPMPSPLLGQGVQESSQRQAEGSRQIAEQPQSTRGDRARSADATIAPPKPATAQARSGDGRPAQPAWYKEGVQTLDGREHRAFAVTAADVRDARNRALRLAYEAYPDGAVAAHEAVLLGDGTWRFYVLMAASG